MKALSAATASFSVSRVKTALSKALPYLELSSSGLGNTIKSLSFAFALAIKPSRRGGLSIRVGWRRLPCPQESTPCQVSVGRSP